MEITTRIRSGQGDFVRFAITPPRQSTPAERLPEIARATVERLDHLVNDGLVLYDIDEERSRNPVERPFPFSPTVDPPEYRAEHLQAWRTPAIVYRAVGKYPREELRTWLTERAEGKKSLEAIRCLKRRISDAIYRQLVADARATAGHGIETGPGGHCRATKESSAVDLPPHIDTSDQPLPGPAGRATPNRLTTEGSR